ncbi:uncharacterized protein LOC132699551 isoform X2 [Cylas formicarius]|uniref:uncharacterized protein LOC132699551 isoform X2 n=2 Tax=Cylas formicarius TaxID=197179 RepID=UPI0029584604|nr:uncharacterized protein LOC132699551 isoform X2 [Cylas formicarius]
MSKETPARGNSRREESTTSKRGVLSNQRSRSETRSALTPSRTQNLNNQPAFKRAHTFGPDQKQLLSRDGDLRVKGILLGENKYPYHQNVSAVQICMGQCWVRQLTSQFCSVCPHLQSCAIAVPKGPMKELKTKFLVLVCRQEVWKNGPDGESDMEVHGSSRTKSQPSRLHEPDISLSKSKMPHQASNGFRDALEDEEVLDQFGQSSADYGIPESADLGLVNDEARSVSTGSSTDRIPMKQSGESQTPQLHLETREFQTEQSEEIKAKIQENLMLDEQSYEHHTPAQHPSSQVVSSAVKTSHGTRQQLSHNSHSTRMTEISSKKNIHEAEQGSSAQRDATASHSSTHDPSAGSARHRKETHGPYKLRSQSGVIVAESEEEKEIHSKDSKSILKKGSTTEICTCCGCADSDSSRFKDSSTSCTCLPCPSNQDLVAKKCKCKRKSKSSSSSNSSKIKIKACCDCSTSTAISTTSSLDSGLDALVEDRGDAVEYDVRYAITKITRFHCYTTFEVMKATRKRPKVMPKSLEGVFVLRNKSKE